MSEDNKIIDLQEGALAHPIFTGSLRHVFERRALPLHIDIDRLSQVSEPKHRFGETHPGHPRYFPPIC